MPGDGLEPFPNLEHVRWASHPDHLDEPVMLVAFEGWNDAGDAATTAVRHLGEIWNAEVFATIDPEEFYDFSSTRPRVELDGDQRRVIVWPENIFSSAAKVRRGLDTITLLGVEPQLRWRTFCNQITGLARIFDVRLVLTLGALLAEVPHTRPVSVFGTAYDQGVIDELGLLPSKYEGPTGIVGVLHAACHDAGLKSASLWAAVPTYLPTVPSPKAGLALVQKAAELLRVDADTGELEIASRSYEEQVNEVVQNDHETAEYVAQLEASFDENDDVFDSGPTLIDEVEQFLRDQD
jgi:predicted ATP-grasp superfamily ATP-dependent carboligase